MKTSWIYKFFKYLKKVYFKNDKRVAAYLVCIAIATGFWFLNALSKTYTVDIIAPVSYVNFPNNKTLANNLPEKFELTIKSYGFTILRRKLSFLFVPLEFNVNDLTSNRMVDSHRSSYTFPSRQFLSKLSYQLSNDLEILNMSPDTLVFKFDKLGQKHIKVKPVVQVNLKKQYQISGEIKTVPDSVLVNGPQSVLDNLHFVLTEKKQFHQVDRSILEEIKIKPVKELYFEPQSVKMNIPVEEYTEAQQSVPVVLVRKPADVNVKLFPAKVKITFQVGLNRFSEIHPEDFKLTVSYTDIQKGKQRLKITAESSPDYLYDLKITPEELEYLIEN
ncbi:MAG: hypothetical protein Q8N05_00605 [Bacteroidota bacterium]|nr:hypothetical protein [Bacteroidota bacterium]